MKLTDLNPVFLGQGGPGVFRRDSYTGELVEAPRREGVGVQFDCPCGCDSPCFVPFRNPLDGGPDESGRLDGGWVREGDTFETLTLRPSIRRLASATSPNGGCGWHGFITNGEVTSC